MLLQHELWVIDVDEDGIVADFRDLTQEKPGQRITILSVSLGLLLIDRSMLRDATSTFTYILSTTQVNDQFLLATRLLQEFFHGMLDGPHSQPVATVDQRRATLEFPSEVLEVLRLVGVV